MNACVEPVDLVTADAKTGGLVDPLTRNVPYKLGATPNIEVDLVIPMGPGISTIEVYNQFRTVDGKASNTVLLRSVVVSNANANTEAESSFTITYEDLISGLTIDGAALPDDELDLDIGDSWSLTYLSVLSGDNRQVWNNAKTSIGVANQYAGNYQVTGVFNHPTAGPRNINERKFLSPIDGVTCLTYAGDLSGFGTDYEIYIIVNPDNSVTVTGSPNTVTDIIMTAGQPNVYDPATGKFTLNYYYNAAAPRVISEVYTPL